MHARRWGIAALLVLVCPVAGLAAQEESEPDTLEAVERAASPEPAERVRVIREPGTPVIAGHVFVATGATADTLAVPGIAHLSARSIVAPIRDDLVAQGARVQVDVEKGGASFTLVAAPDLWHTAMRQLLVAVFRDPPIDEAVRTERQAIASELRARAPNPTDVVARVTDQAVFGEDHPWSVPTTGAAEVVERITADQVDAYLRAHFLPERTLVAVTGPADPGEIRSFLRPFLGSEGSLRTEPAPFEPADEPVRAEYPFITTWITVSYLLPPDADFDALRLLGDIVTDRLGFGPQSREVYNIRSNLRLLGHGAELRLEMVVPAGEGDRWEERLVDTVEGFSSGTLSRREFQDAYRAYRGNRLHALLLPEERAAEHVASLRLLHESGVSTDPLPGDVTAERLRDAARALRDPVRAQIGPFSRPEEGV